MVHPAEQGLKLQILVAVLIAVLVLLHYLLWLDENGVRQTHTLRIGIRAQTEENVELAERNRGLAAEVEDLKRGLMAIEEQARSDMGMIRQGETFYRLLEKPAPLSAIPNKTAPVAKPAPPAQTPVPAAKPAPPAQTLAPVAKPPAQAKSPSPASKPASPAKPPAQAKSPGPASKPVLPAKPPVQAKSPGPASKPASPAKPPAPAIKPTPTPGAAQRRE
jgi:cell division protein FtsB